MITKGITLSEEQMGKLFPHHILIDNTGVILSFSSLLRDNHNLDAGNNIHDSFRIIANDSIYNDLNDITGTECHLIPKKETYHAALLLGRFEYIDDNNSLIFIVDNDSFEEKPVNVSAHLLRVLIGNFQSGILFEHSERTVLQANNSLCKLFNVPLHPNELVGMDCKAIATQIKTIFKEPEDFILRINEIVTLRKPVYNDILHLTDGRVFKRDFIPIEDKGIPTGFLWIYDDITERTIIENQLKEQRAYFHRILNELPVDIMIFSLDHRFEFINKNAVKDDEMREWMIGKNMFDYCERRKIPIELAERRDIGFKSTIAQNKPTHHIDKHILKDGSHQYMLRYLYPFSKDGEVEFIVGFGTDITEQINKEIKLQEQKEYYNQILNELPADIVIFSSEHKYLFINKNAIKDDYIREWLIGKDDYDYCELKKIDKKFADQRRALFNKTVESKKPQTLLNEHQNKNGDTEYILRIMYPSLNALGDVKYIIGYGVDITDQMKDRKFAEIQESRIKKLFDIIRDGVFRCDLDGNINISNNSFQYILNRDNNLNDSEVVNFYDFLSIDEAKKVKRNVHFLMETGEPQSGIIRIAQEDGSEKYLDYTFTKAIENEDAAFVGRISDITELVNKERSLKQIIEKEKELNNSKSQFVRITSHELRTPLAIIQANAEILGMLCNKFQANEHDLNPEVMIGRITKEVKLMTEILNELMLISKIETGSIEFHPHITDVSEFIHDTTHDMFFPFTDGRSLTIDVAQDITTAIFDKKLMRHALVNLINNAFKYSIGKLPPVLSVSMSGDSLVFTVKDYGIGIPKEEQKKLFSSFFRASNVGAIHGTGLGLTVIDYAVKKHFGTISYKSDVNTGTVFSISIPLTQRI